MIPLIQAVRPGLEWRENMFISNSSDKKIRSKAFFKGELRRTGDNKELKIKKRFKTSCNKEVERKDGTVSKSHINYDVIHYNNIGVIKGLKLLFDLDRGYYDIQRKWVVKQDDKQVVTVMIGKNCLFIIKETTKNGMSYYGKENPVKKSVVSIPFNNLFESVKNIETFDISCMVEL